MKKVIAFLCILLLLSQSVCIVTADTPTIVVSEVMGMPGETVAVTVRFEGNPGLISAKVKVGYDAAALEFVEVEEGDFPPAWYSFGNPEKNPFVVTFCNGTAGGNYAAQLFATLRFKIREDAPVGTYPLTLTCDFEGDFFNCDWDAVYFGIDEGSVTVVRTGNTKPTSPATTTPASPTGTGDDTTEPTVAAPVTSATATATKPTATLAATPTDTDTPAPSSAPLTTLWISLAVAAVLIAGSVLVVLLRKKRS